MIPAAFEYAAPTTLDGVIQTLVDNEDDAKLLAGGHSLLPLMKLRLAAPALLVDLGRVPDLAYIRDAGDHVAIGAMTTEYALESSDLLRDRLPLLAEAAGMIGDQQVRNRGTIGGSLAHADPASDLPTVVTALRGEIIATGPNGQRSIPAEEFFQDIWTSVLDPTEVLTEVRIPYVAGAAQTYEKFRLRAADWAIVGVAISATRQDGNVGDISVVLTNVGPTPVRAKGVEDALKGGPVTREVIATAAEKASDGLEPSGELKASPDYKRHLARVLTRRALERVLIPA